MAMTHWAPGARRCNSRRWTTTESRATRVVGPGFCCRFDQSAGQRKTEDRDGAAPSARCRDTPRARRYLAVRCSRDTSLHDPDRRRGRSDRCPTTSRRCSRTPIGRRQGEATQREPAHVAATEVVHMTEVEAFRKAAVFEGMVELKAAITAAPIVTKPVAVGVHVRSVWMAGAIDESVLVRDWGAVKRHGGVARNDTAAELVAPTFVAAATLSAGAFRPGDRWRDDECRHEKQTEDPAHSISPDEQGCRLPPRRMTHTCSERRAAMAVPCLALMEIRRQATMNGSTMLGTAHRPEEGWGCDWAGASACHRRGSDGRRRRGMG